MTSILTKTFWIIWTMIGLLLIGTLVTNLEITSRLAKNGLTYIFILGLVRLMTINRPWTLTKKLTLSTMIFGLFLVATFFSDWRGHWETQKIIYQNKHLCNRTIELQIQDKGALGFNRRTVDRIKLLPFVSWTRNLSKKNLEDVDTLTWDKVDIELNDHGFKGG